MPDLQQFGFQALWSPFALIFTVLIGILYLYVTGPMREKFKDAEPVPLKRKLLFFSGLALLYLALAGPLNLLAHLMFTYHMLAMAIAFLAAPPLVLLGIPAWLLRPLFKITFVKKASKVLLNPILTLLMFNGMFSFYHLPVIMDTVMTNYALHYFIYALLLFAAFCMWWPVIDPVPELGTLTHLKKMGYMFANGVLLTPACAMIIFAPEPLFQMYNDPMVWAKALGYCVPGDPQLLLQLFQGPENFSLMPPRDDQQLGGIVMKFMQEIMYGSILAYNFKLWYRSEHPEDDEPDDPAALKRHYEQLNNA